MKRPRRLGNDRKMYSRHAIDARNTRVKRTEAIRVDQKRKTVKTKCITNDNSRPAVIAQRFAPESTYLCRIRFARAKFPTEYYNVVCVLYNFVFILSSISLRVLYVMYYGDYFTDLPFIKTNVFIIFSFFFLFFITQNSSTSQWDRFYEIFVSRQLIPIIGLVQYSISSRVWKRSCLSGVNTIHRAKQLYNFFFWKTYSVYFRHRK